MMVRAFVTGGNGFTGRHLRGLLESEGVSVYLAERPTNWEDPSPFLRHFQANPPDYVFHLAGLATGDSLANSYLANVQYGAPLLTALGLAGLASTPTLFVGTAAEYGLVSDSDLPITEEAQAKPAGIYGASKLAQTKMASMAAQTHKALTVVRPFNLIGPGMPPHIAAEAFASQIRAIRNTGRRGTLEVGNLTSTRDFLDVRDAVNAYWAIIRNPAAYGRVINVCSGTELSIAAMLNRLIELSGCDIEVRTDPTRLRTVDVPRHFGNPSLMRSLAPNVTFRQLDETLRDILAHAKPGA